MLGEAVVDVLRAYPHCRARSEAALLAWLRRIADREVATLFRREADAARWGVSLQSVVETAGDPPGAEPPASDPRIDSLRPAVEALDPDRHVLLWLHIHGAATWAEVGAELGVSAGAAKRRWQRLQARLRRLAGG